MATITFCMLPELGHILPTLRIAHLLRCRGHRIRYLITTEFVDLVQNCGFEFSLLRLGDAAHAVSADSKLPSGISSEELYRAVFYRVTRRDPVEAEIVAGIMSTNPNLLIIDSAACGVWREGSQCSLTELCCPVVRLSVTFGDEYEFWPFPLPDYVNALPELILCPQEMDLPLTRRTRHQRHFVEPSIFQRRPATMFPWDRLNKRKRLAFCSFGTQSHRYHDRAAVLDNLIEVFGGMEEYQLVIVNRSTSPNSKRAQTKSNVLICESVPQLEIMSCANIFIGHGGLGGIKEAISAGVPMVVIPFAHDQPFNARRVTHHGLGVALTPSTATVEALRRSLQSVEKEVAFRNNVNKFRLLFSAMERNAPSVSRIEALLPRGTQ